MLIDANQHYYSVLLPVSQGYPKDKGMLCTRYSPVRHYHALLRDRSTCMY